MDEHETSNETKEDPEKKYPALRFIARFYKKLGVFIGCLAILAIIFSIVGLTSGVRPGGLLGDSFSLRVCATHYYP